MRVPEENWEIVLIGLGVCRNVKQLGIHSRFTMVIDLNRNIALKIHKFPDERPKPLESLWGKS